MSLIFFKAAYSRFTPRFESEETIQMNPDLVDFFTSNCPGLKYFKKSLIHEKNPDQDFISQLSTGQCLQCQTTVKVENISDIYLHLYDCHRELYGKSLIPSGDQHIYAKMNLDTVLFAKEEVKDICYLKHNMMRSVSAIDRYTRIKMIKKVRHLFQNRQASQLILNDDVFKHLHIAVEKYLSVEVVL